MSAARSAVSLLLQADGFVVDEDFADGDEGEEGEGGGGEGGSGGEEDAGVRKKRRKRRRDKQFALDEEDYDLLEEAVSLRRFLGFTPKPRTQKRQTLNLQSWGGGGVKSLWQFVGFGVACSVCGFGCSPAQLRSHTLALRPACLLLLLLALACLSTLNLKTSLPPLLPPRLSCTHRV